MLESVFLQLESIGLQHLLEPLIDTQYFGCPENCIVQGSEEHQLINFVFSPILYVIIGISVGVGLLVKLKRRIKKVDKKLPVETYSSKIQNFKKNEKKEFLRKTTLIDPQKAYQQWVSSLDPEHPQTDYIQAVGTEAKEIVMPEQKILEQKVQKIMLEENISEDKATDKIVEQIKIPELASRIVDQDGEEKDIFKQDIPPKKYPKPLQRFEKTFRKLKKQKPKTRLILTDLGKIRRDQYAEQIEKRLLSWTLPMPEYLGKNKNFQKEHGEILLGIKKLSLFLSMGEFIIDHKRKKKRYWSKIAVE